MKKPGRHHRSGEDRAATNDLAAGRSAYERRAWGEAYELLAQADASSPLGADDLEMFAWAAALTGRDAECLAAQERLYRLCIDAGRDLRAARSAFWQGMRFLTLGEMAQGGAWLARAEAIVGDRDCSERGQLLLPVAYGHLRAGQDDAAVAAADKAITIGARFNEPDIIALAQNIKGRAMVHRGEIADGLALLDRAMLSAAPGDVTPIVTGLVYCNVIDCCQSVYALERSREWTAALTAWCAEQPELVTFAGSCHVHRAELMQISGDWDDAVAEARRASQHLSQAIEPDAIAPARYQEAEVYRLRGAFDEAEAAYRDVARLGQEPQPGFALLRLSQGRGDAAAAAIRRVVDAAVERLERARTPARLCRNHDRCRRAGGRGGGLPRTGDDRSHPRQRNPRCHRRTRTGRAGSRPWRRCQRHQAATQLFRGLEPLWRALSGGAASRAYRRGLRATRRRRGGGASIRNGTKRLR